jgi:5-methylcytosine-specific restriction protein A
MVQRAGYCDEHRRARLRATERLRPSPRERGYDAEWRRVRRAYLRAHPTCERCGAAAVSVHHRERGPLELGGNDPANLEALCEPCHAADSGKRRWGRARTK